MTNGFNCDWIDFYSTFANTLLNYKNDRQTLINKIKNIFYKTGIKLPQLEKNNNIVDIDPFTVFGIFNKEMTNDNRMKIIKGFTEEFSIKRDGFDSFDGIPVLNPLKSTFYFMDERKRDDIENLWHVFESAINFADNPNELNRNNFIFYFDTVLKQKGIRWNIIMGLYWIRPYTFINLDQRNRVFFCDTQYMPSEFIQEIKGLKSHPSGKSYLQICDKITDYIKNKAISYESLPEVSFKAWEITRNNKFDNVEYGPSLNEYNPNISSKQWLEVLSDPNITYEENLKMLNMMLEFGGKSTCANLAKVFGNTALYYNRLGSSFGGRVFKKFACPNPPDNGEVKYFTILFVGKPVTEDGEDRYSWKLRPELKEALEEMSKDSINITTQKKAEIDKNTILYGPPGTGKTYNTVLYAVAIIENKTLEELKVEDKYEVIKKRYDDYKSKGLIEFTTFHQSFGYEEFIEGIRPVMDNEDDEPAGDIKYEVVDGVFKDFCEKGYMPDNSPTGINDNPKFWKVSLAGVGKNEIKDYCFENNCIRVGFDKRAEKLSNDEDPENTSGKSIINIMINKMNIGDIVMVCSSKTEIEAIGVITGDYDFKEEFKTYKSFRSVQWIFKGEKVNILSINNNKTMSIATVHELVLTINDVMPIIQKYNPGFGEKVNNQKKTNKVFIIDEINRGNISKIFGELITLIEPTKRIGESEELRSKLPYSKKYFGIPDNVYILGTMNTADRSIAALDTALRRRFSFVEMMPDYSYLDGVTVENISIKELLITLNERIEAIYDREHTIGHAYFKEVKENPTIHTLGRVFSKKIIPLLQEYFYEDYEKIRLVLGDNQKGQEEPLFIEVKEINKKLFGNYDFDDDKQVYNVNEYACFNADAYSKLGQRG